MACVAREKTLVALVAVLAVGAAVTFAAVGAGQGPGHRASARHPSVLGESITKPSTPPQSPAPGAQAPSPVAAPPSPAGAANPPAASPTAAVPPARAAPLTATSRASGRRAPAPAAPAGPVTLHSFNRSTFVFSPDSSESSSTSSFATTRATPSGPVALEVLGRAEGSQATLSARVTNNSGRPISFPGGLSVTFALSRDGAVVESATVIDRATSSLAPGASAGVARRVPLSSYGSYSVEGTSSYR